MISKVFDERHFETKAIHKNAFLEYFRFLLESFTQVCVYEFLEFPFFA